MVNLTFRLRSTLLSVLSQANSCKLIPSKVETRLAQVKTHQTIRHGGRASSQHFSAADVKRFKCRRPGSHCFVLLQYFRLFIMMRESTALLGSHCRTVTIMYAVTITAAQASRDPEIRA